MSRKGDRRDRDKHNSDLYAANRRANALYVEHLRRTATVERTTTSPCPECGHCGPHEDNGIIHVANRSYSCAGCGLCFDALTFQT